MVSIVHLFRKNNKVSAGSSVQCLYRGVSYVGKVVGVEHKKDRYTIRICEGSRKEAYLSRKRHQIEPIEDVEFQNVIEESQYIDSILAGYETDMYLEVS